jgi:hypothetical protein
VHSGVIAEQTSRQKYHRGVAQECRDYHVKFFPLT